MDPLRYRFGEWTLDQGRRELLRGGQAVHLSPKALGFLELLLARAPNAVSKQEIQEALWPQTFVSEANLTKLMAEVRMALAEDARQPRFIRTVHGFGYAFCGTTEADQAGGSNAEAGTWRDEPCGPYPGLAAFTEADTTSFFGREGEVEGLWAKLRRRKLLALIGPSGVGKTSFLRAGLLPAPPAGWACLLLTPGTRPQLSLARALLREIAGDVAAIERLLSLEAAAIVAGFSDWRRRHAETLVVVDQFEELFTVNPAEVRGAFADLLGRLVADSDVHVLLSLRDDFLFPCHEHAALADVFAELTPLGPLRGAALERALVEPARRAGFEFEDAALPRDMLSAVEGERGALPLLAFAAARLWERRDRARKVLTRDAYEEIGGVAGALAQHAEAALERIGPERGPIAREVFRSLATAQGTRAVSDREELLSTFPDRHEAWEVVRQLVDARLLTSYEVDGREGGANHHRVEIVHESLLKAWPRLVRWQAQDAEGALLRDQLRQAAHLWDEKGRTPDLLWTGTAEREFELWRERYPGRLTAVESEFARAMIERERRRKRARRLFAVCAVAAALLAATVTGLLWLRSEAARGRAVAESRRAEASKLLALAQARLETDATEALALTTASLELGDTGEARLFAMKVLWMAPPALDLPGGGRSVKTPAFSPDGRRLAVGGHSEDVLVFDETGRRLARLAGHASSPSGNRAEWASSSLLITGMSVADRLHLWSLPEGRRVRTIELGGFSSWRSAADRLLVAASVRAPNGGGSGHRVRSWAMPDGDVEEVGRIHSGSLAQSVYGFTPAGTGWIYADGPAVHLRELPARPGTRDRLVTRHASDVLSIGRPDGMPGPLYTRDGSGEIRLITFPASGPPRVEAMRQPEVSPEPWPEPSGRWFVAHGLAESRVRLWARASWPGARPLVLRRNVSWYNTQVAVHPRGDWLVASTARFASLTFWPLRAERPAIADGYAHLMRPITFSPDGRWLATSWTDHQPRLWPVGEGMRDGPRVLSLPGRQARADLAFEPVGRFLFVVGNAAHIVPLDGAPPRPLAGFSSGVLLTSAAISPSGRQVATAFSYGQGPPTLRVWDLESETSRAFDLPEGPKAPAVRGAAVPVNTGSERGVVHLCFADEAVLYTSGDGGIRRWDLRSGAHELVFATKPGWRTFMFPDPERRVALVREQDTGNLGGCSGMNVVELATGASRPVPAFGDCPFRAALARSPAGVVAAVGGRDGIVRVGRLAGGEPHVLVGHEGMVDFVAISPDLRWVASTGEDNTLRLWPMPDLDKPPLHTLPREELIEKLKSLTNLRAARDPAVPSGWTIEIGPFPGWRDLPTW